MYKFQCSGIISYDAAKLENVVKFMCPLGPFSLTQSHIIELNYVEMDTLLYCFLLLWLKSYNKQWRGSVIEGKSVDFASEWSDAVVTIHAFHYLWLCTAFWFWLSRNDILHLWNGDIGKVQKRFNLTKL